jgi:hypothetical protein
MPKHALFFVYVWPEPCSSAAGVRTRELIAWLLSAGWKVSAISPSKKNEFSSELAALGVNAISCAANQSAQDAELAALPVDLVVFDRFVMEEQFGWKARSFWPDALQVVDTQDLHSLRRVRETMLKSGASLDAIARLPEMPLSEDLVRELSSLHRADAAFVVSSWEFTFLATRFHFPTEKLLHLPLIGRQDTDIPDFDSRSGIAFLGNFRHPPNLDGINWLLEHLWPSARQALPHIDLHLYGAYPPSQISAWKGKHGVYAHGPIRDHRQTLKKHRATVAPLRFGAGIKGKILESWGTGTPVLGTAIAFEGMAESNCLFEDAETFQAALRKLEADRIHWEHEQALGFENIHASFQEERLRARFFTFVEGHLNRLRTAGRSDLLGTLLRHNSANATKYFSRWIEEKNKKAGM